MASKKKQKKMENKAPSLLKVLAFDIFVRHWWVSALAVLLVISAMMLAHTSHEARRMTADFQTLRQSYSDEQVVWEALRLEMDNLV